MNNLSDRTAYLAEDPVRVEVALVCREAPRTKAEIARSLGREAGGISAPKTLEKKGVLRKVGSSASRTTRGGGVQWELEPEWLEAVELAANHIWKGLLTTDIDLILIRTTDVVEACRVLVTQKVSVAWAIPLRGEQMGLLICPSVLPSEQRVLNVLHALRGANPIRLHLPAVMSEQELLSWAREVGGEAVPLALNE